MGGGLMLKKVGECVNNVKIAKHNNISIIRKSLVILKKGNKTRVSGLSFHITRIWFTLLAITFAFGFD